MGSQEFNLEDALLETNCPDLKLVKRGKVRDIYEVPGEEDKLLFVATDRISAFDIIMKNGIPNKGKLLTKLSVYFFHKFQHLIPNHLITSDWNQISSKSNLIQKYSSQLKDRTILVKKSQVLNCEAIVRGYLTGSAWKEYQQTGTVHGIQMPEGLLESYKFPEPIFTPSTKAEIGDHDQNIHPDQLSDLLGSKELSNQIQKTSIDLYNLTNEHCKSINSTLFLVDTKFEYGIDPQTSNLILIDECLTPDSSRFSTIKDYQIGQKFSGFDKQFLRDWILNQTELNLKSMKDFDLEIPKDVLQITWKKYLDGFQNLTGFEFQC
ncbi:uncharacterized protein MELLADRAFT_42976 [Melampsora larici-populina 98AG31]|uniref:Phosphoribosylaminoimidazole-succinocarboxamide synthase n=1 Tax=Melampsora larici-populina (strain 98AG31 / pathotype 3-4-7) TaxID=747676 RepID=F4RHN0_MELLP|nr:uncharacterized protein MELLADRAFT_42976 [Melampsora larici-populina 98AG31]EGG08106.1 hypothetical protein MELLADRAFT_42976 [Melampsora larici-populina 98AG31]